MNVRNFNIKLTGALKEEISIFLGKSCLTKKKRKKKLYYFQIFVGSSSAKNDIDVRKSFYVSGWIREFAYGKEFLSG
jgi:hypothetical protein